MLQVQLLESRFALIFVYYLFWFSKKTYCIYFWHRIRCPNYYYLFIRNLSYSSDKLSPLILISRCKVQSKRNFLKFFPSRISPRTIKLTGSILLKRFSEVVWCCLHFSFNVAKCALILFYLISLNLLYLHYLWMNKQTIFTYIYRQIITLALEKHDTIFKW